MARDWRPFRYPLRAAQQSLGLLPAGGGAATTRHGPTGKQKQALGTSLAKFAANINFQKPIIKR